MARLTTLPPKHQTMKKSIGYRFYRKTKMVEGSVSVNIKECTREEAPIAMVVKSFDCQEREIRAYKGNLYGNVQDRLKERPVDGDMEINVTADSFEWQTYLGGGLTWDLLFEPTEDLFKQHIKKAAAKYLLIDGMVFERTTEPVYNITIFGVMYSAGMFIDHKDKHTSRNPLNFSALEREKCKETLRKLLAKCEQKRDNSEFYDIQVLKPEYVKYKRPKKYDKES